MNNCCDLPGLLSLSSAMELLDQAVSPIQAFERIDLMHALDRILAEDMLAAANIPNHDNSAMDGYAVRSADIQKGVELKLIGKSFAGNPFNGSLSKGEAVRIMTGAVIPEGADSVVMQEYCVESDQRLSVQLEKVKIGDHIRPAGDDIQKGVVVVKQHRRLSPVDLGLLASLGSPDVLAFKQPKIAVFSTGDELKEPGQALTEGSIYESNRYVIISMLRRLNFEIVDLGIIPDSPQAIQEAFTTAASSCDAIISSGGVSVGEADFTRDILREIGDINFYKLAIKPGKPFAFGKINGALFFGLPGNPVSSAVTFHQLAIPALRKLSGEGFITPDILKAQTTSAIKKRPGRTDFQRGVYRRSTSADTPLIVESLKKQSSGVLSSLSSANCFIRLEQERGPVSPGETVDIIPYDQWLL